MTLTANLEVDRLVDQELREYPVAASVNIFKGALVGMDPTGNVRPFRPCDLFVGIAYESKDNSSGAAATLKVRLFVQTDFVYTLTGVADADVGKAVYATDDDALALTGHPDAFVGRVVGKFAADKATIRLKNPGEKTTPADAGSIRYTYEQGKPLTVTGAAGSGTEVHTSGWRVVSGLGLGVTNVAAAGGGIGLEHDAVAEVARASIETENVFLASKGVTFKGRLHLLDIGDDAALDAFWGLVDAITANTRASVDHGDATDIVGFHLDGNVANILAESDDGSTDVAPVDTTIDNVTTAGSYKTFQINVLTDGVCEIYIDGVRMLAGTVFKVATTAVLAATVNLEKTSNDTTAKVRIVELEAAGAGV